MKAKIFVASVIAAGFFAAPALAGDNDAAVTGAAGGAATGAIIGGPVGAAVGGAVGLAAGAALSPPLEPVITYVEQQPIPAETITIEQPVVVGKPLPRTVMLTPVPENPAYAYAVVNQKRVIVDPKTYTVVQVVQ